MSTGKKIAIIIAAALMGLGILCSTAAAVLLGFDFTKLNAADLSDKTYEIHESFDSIDIYETEYTIRLQPSEDGVAKVTCRESEDNGHTVTVENGTLKITRTDRRKWYEHIGIFWANDTTLTLHLPQSQYKTLSAQSVSGHLIVPEAFTFESATLCSTSGDIFCYAQVKDSFSATSISGEVVLKNQTGGTLTASTTSGDLHLFDICVSSIALTTTSGDIECNAVIADGQLQMEAVSGNVELNKCDGGSLQIKTVSGDIIGTLRSGKWFITNTTSGDIRVPTSHKDGGNCALTTTSGDIKIALLTV